MNGATINFTDEELIFAAMHHDLGKVGDELGNEFYTPNESEWHIKNQGKIYNVIQNYNIWMLRTEVFSYYNIMVSNILQENFIGIEINRRNVCKSK